ncbi:glycosyl hydrolase family 67 [Flavobacterium sp. 1]|uniref:glycosyl hydrolase 115 family protein n=1 Tax=Flavobacterium sp. 1 TaxID=2035200 RepID=UPI000CC36E65|nr:glycosyl hydrolase 115 family protein [Flavobacterium sp. 1]PJJ07649.1 glycosyl hydrolase family 67 [Flavobacterium sp. 1]
MIQSKMKFYTLSLILLVTVNIFGQSTKKSAQQTPSEYVLHQMEGQAFKIAANGKSVSIYADPNDWKGVIRAAKDLGDDVRKVTGTASPVFESAKPEKNTIVVGTIGKSSIIDKLIAAKKIDVSAIKGQWESFLIQTVDGQLVVAGSDKRGTIYGIYDISEKIGVSPWYFWADVPIKKAKELYIKHGTYIQNSPKVKYRGIFINDEEPSFAQWARGAYGGINSKMYATIFELLLRLKANYLWPAMWGKSFNEDDPLNPVIADEYGIVMGTSHHEPMMRSQKEYTDRKKEIGEWNYASNKRNIEQFFYEGLERNKNFDNLITVGMRGEGDVAMGEGDDLENIKTLQNVIKSQREIIQKVYNDKPENHPQVWAIFTEVQRYYDAGLTVPDDVILLFCDNNWGNIRRTYPEKEKNRKGGGGLYYHIDMNGGPWNDRWINTTTIPKLQEQFNLAYQSGIDKLWIVNVGDLKPRELPVDFIMRFAWNPDAIPADKVQNYTVDWVRRIFGNEHEEEIADIVSKYTKYNLWRKPEAQVPNIFSSINYHESDRVLKLWKEVVEKAEKLQSKIPAEAQDTYYQLVLYPAKASAVVAEIYLASDKNMLYAKQGRITANDFYKRVQDLFEEDKKMSDYYNDTMANGKWKNMMSDVHMGYKMWSMPKENSLPEIKQVTPLNEPTIGVAIEGNELSWPNTAEKAVLPLFDGLTKSSYYIDVFNRGTGTFEFTAKADKPWIKLSQSEGIVEKEIRIQVEIDRNALSYGTFDGSIEISQGTKTILVKVSAVNAPSPKINEPYFGSLTGEFAIPSNKYNANIPGEHAKWTVLPDLGRSDACMGIYPVTAPSANPGSAPRLEYKVFLSKKGKTKVCLGILPTQDINPARGLRIAAALDNQTPQIIDARKGLVDTFSEYTPSNLAHSKVLKPLPALNKDIEFIGNGKLRRNEIFDNMRWLDIEFEAEESGIHTLKIFMIDPEIVLEKIIVNPDNKYPSYFGAVPMQYNVK